MGPRAGLDRCGKSHPHWDSIPGPFRMSYKAGIITISHTSDSKNNDAINYRVLETPLTFRRRIKSRLPFAGIIRRLSYSTCFQDKG